ncbi:serine/threonine protein kinase [Aspergillus undulatus]|uniref:serine/threonine protein kinase n=1 Tax=Aspergillus undulatus TaxID=1810928 RepID=UPI003CCD80C8
MASYPNIKSIGSFTDSEILGIGGTGMVIREGNTAIKLPFRCKGSLDSEIELNIDGIQREQEIYRQIGECDSVVPVLGFTETSTTLKLMENGDLHSYLRHNLHTPLPKHLKLSWFQQMARGLAQIHDRRVLVLDIASRNLLLDDYLSIKFCDFTEATRLPLDTDMEKVNDYNSTVQTDIAQLAAVMYEVVTGEQWDFNSFLNDQPNNGAMEWPQQTKLRKTRGIWLGDIIRKAWTQGAFCNAYELLRELESVRLEDEPTINLTM